jgi:hypothetical protein
MIPLSMIPWRLVLWGAAFVAVAWLAFKLFAWAGDTIERAGKYETAIAAQREAEDRHSAYVAATAREALAAAQRLEADMLADATLAAKLERVSAENDELRRHAARVPATVEKADAKGVLVASINPHWWLCNGAAPLGGLAADAAACAAGAGAGAVPAR